MAHPEPTNDFVGALISCLEPVRQGFLAQVIVGLFDAGIYAALDANPCTGDHLARLLGFKQHRLDALLTYACHEELIERRPDGSFCIGRLRDYARFLPWFELLIGGYHETLNDLPRTLRDDSLFGARDISHVSRGSAGISRYDTVPALLGLLSSAGIKLPSVVDIGCSDACYLVALCEHGVARAGVGIEANVTAARQAQSLVDAQGLSDQISIVALSAQEYFASVAERADGYIAAFVLQELLAQSGRPYVLSLLRTIRGHSPKARLFVIEVDFDPQSSRLSNGLGRAYYNPYYLLHAFTKQTLMSRPEWERLFVEAGYSVAATAHPSPAVDPTRFEVCFLLEPREGDDPASTASQRP